MKFALLATLSILQISCTSQPVPEFVAETPSQPSLFAQPQPYKLIDEFDASPRWVGVGDINGDHLDDIVVATERSRKAGKGTVYLQAQGELNGIWVAPDGPTSKSATIAPILLDWNGDGISELLQPDPSNLFVTKWGQGEGSSSGFENVDTIPFLYQDNPKYFVSIFREPNDPSRFSILATWRPNGGAVAVAADWDTKAHSWIESSKKDLWYFFNPSSPIVAAARVDNGFLATAGSDIQLLSEDQIGSPLNRPIPVGGSSIRALAAANLNGDGKLDAVTANSGSDNVSVFLAVEHGFEDEALLEVGKEPVGLVLVDVNADSFVDILTVNSLSNGISILLNSGSLGQFEAAQNYLTGQRPVSIAVGDLNGDGKIDVVTANYGSKDISVLLQQ